MIGDIVGIKFEVKNGLQTTGPIVILVFNQGSRAKKLNQVDAILAQEHLIDNQEYTCFSLWKHPHVEGYSCYKY
jgi:hypothetical protein